MYVPIATHISHDHAGHYRNPALLAVNWTADGGHSAARPTAYKVVSADRRAAHSLVWAGILVAWLPPDVGGFHLVLARGWHARLSPGLPAYVPFSPPSPVHAGCAEHRGEHAPVEDEAREVKLPNYEHGEYTFNGGGQAAKTCRHSHVLPVRESADPSVHRNLSPSSEAGCVHPVPTRSSIPAGWCHMLERFCQVWP
jgi:hypothetical protein